MTGFHFTSSKVAGLSLRRRSFLINLQAFSFSKVAAFYLWRIYFEYVRECLALIKLLAPICKKVSFYLTFAGFYSSFTHSSLYDVWKASGKYSLKRGPLYAAATSQEMKNFQMVKLRWLHNVTSFFLGSDTTHSFVKNIFFYVTGRNLDSFWWSSYEHLSTGISKLHSFYITQVSVSFLANIPSHIILAE